MNAHERKLLKGAITSSLIKEAAEELLRDCCITSLDDFPISLVKIANNLGYTIREFTPKSKEEKNISGLLCREDRKIIINKNDSRFRKRFTIAHEIGHIQLHPLDSENKDQLDYRRGDKNDKELQADQFAACLLMPEKFFDKIWQNKNGNFDEISDFFLVSKGAVGLRAVNLGLE